MILRGIKRAAIGAVMGTVLSGCLAALPGSETGPFAPGNTLTFYYQSVLTDPPEQAQIVECGDQFVARSCVRLSNGAQFQLEATETGVVYGNADLRMILKLDAGGVSSGVGQLNNIADGTATGLRWVSLPS